MFLDAAGSSGAKEDPGVQETKGLCEVDDEFEEERRRICRDILKQLKNIFIRNIVGHN